MIKAIIIDDEPLARSIVREYIETFNKSIDSTNDDGEKIEILTECGDGFEGVKAIAQERPDLIFLDVQMPKINGFEMLELLDEKPPVIFTTAFDEYAMKAFDTHAVDYLLKPFSRERFEAAIAKWKLTRNHISEQAKTNRLLENHPQPEEHSRVVVKTGTKIRIIPVHEVMYFEAYDDYVKIHTADGSHLKKKTMQYYEQILNPITFVRVHRSFILQVSQITRIESTDKENHIAILKNNAKIPLSKTGYPKLKSVLGL